MFREYGFIVNERNRRMDGEDTADEYIEVTDFVTGQKKRVKKVNSI